jgi:hypothetical protein
MLNFKFLFGQLKKSPEVCYIKKQRKMKFTMCNMCRMMWKLPQGIYIA